MSYNQYNLPSFNNISSPINFQQQKAAMTVSTYEDNQWINQDIASDLRQFQILAQQNQWLRAEIERKKAIIEMQKEIRSGGKWEGLREECGDDIVLWELRNRNKYLNNKNEELRKIQMNQARQIQKVQNSEEWNRRNKCGPDNCYTRKYLRLLRVKSPLF